MKTAREVEEWIGATPDTRCPPRVALRVIDRADNRCEECRNEFSVFLQPEIDHTVALINGGENRESNLRALCQPCHGAKTATDVAEKSIVARKRAKHLGIEGRKYVMPGSRAHHLRKRLDGIVERRDGKPLGSRYQK